MGLQAAVHLGRMPWALTKEEEEQEEEGEEEEPEMHAHDLVLFEEFRNAVRAVQFMSSTILSTNSDTRQP
jgi:hypothetical protein